ncbi:hypothetical protein CUJ83_12770 [Methanocella sp. CWC-04]|uniref:Uncharacterized protein n=1 Tax=Methanooceanicella nereidis TaxID=2052831 RepID=A0AAP2REJ6_9EURY|nr:hypothetical protein [Methanocella sp. CWC-04]MCD1295869.1 hypothetical protein [Methanocella sp. CWC-04]
MEPKYAQAVKAGVIGGILLALSHVLMLVINVVISWIEAVTIIGLLGCCIWIFLMVIAAGTGALATRYAAPYITGINDALSLSAVAGLVAGILSAIAQMIIAFIEPILLGTTYEYTSTITEGLGTGLGLGLGSAVGSACCCAPFSILFTIIFAAIGGAIYAYTQLKIK